MLFYLKKSDGTCHYFLEQKEYSVGRRECDILITNDKSISRKHAILFVQESYVVLKDCASKYNTFHNEEKIKANVQVRLEPGSVIKFGVMESVYSLQCERIVTTTSRISPTEKNKLKDIMNYLGGRIEKNWTSQCSHLTVEEITLTVKVLHALIDHIPIVTPIYWTTLEHNVRNCLPPPNVATFGEPPVAEALLNKVSFEFNPMRKTLFAGKVFVFSDNKTKEQMAEVVMKAGGDVISWEKQPLSAADKKKMSKEILLIQSGNVGQASQNKIDILQQGKRSIPMQEIALAIVMCSCEQNCNPDFNRVNEVFTTAQLMEFSQNTPLALETQSQNEMQTKSTEDRKHVIIPESVPIDLDSLMPLKRNPLTNISVKRGNTDNNEEQPSKKVKKELELSAEKQSVNVKINEFVKEVTNKSVKNEFDRPSGSKNKRINPFALRKGGMTKKFQPNSSNLFANVFSQSQSQVTKMDKNSGKKRKINNEGEVEAKRSRNVNVFTSTQNMGNVKNLSLISLDISHIKKNTTWCSKKTINFKECQNRTIKIENNPELEKIMQRFKNTSITITTFILPDKSKQLVDVTDGIVNGTNGKKNFKKFKKVAPLRPQTTIISRNHFIERGSGKTDVIAANSFSDDDEVDNDFKRKKKPTGKGKKFPLHFN